MEHRTTKYSLIIITGFILGLSSCYYDVEQELYPFTGCNTENITFQDSVNRILSIHGCQGCHNDQLASGGVNLVGYNNVKIVVDNGRLLGAINHEDGFIPMPQNAPKIPQCDIDKVTAWINDGALNN